MLFKGILWDLTDKFLNQGISFIISIFLARILTPEDFGLIGMVLVVVSFSQVFMDLGFSNALIHKQEVSEIQLSTIFYLNILIGCILTILMFVSSDFVAFFYEEDSISPLMRALAFLFFINSFSIVQNSLFVKDINLKPLAIIRGISVLISGGTGLLLAYKGFGVWSLVYQSLINSIIFSILIWYISAWKPLFLFELSSVKDLWKYGYKLGLASLLDNIISKVDVLIIGKIFNSASLGYYTRAQSLNSFVVTYTSGSLMKVFFPAMSKYQNDLVRTIEIYRAALVVVAFASLGFISVLYVCATNIIIILFTEKWLPSVEYFKILVLGGYAYPLSSIMVNVISARGKSGDFLKLDIIKKGIFILVIVLGFNIGITGFLYGLVIYSFIAVLINIYFVDREINLSFLSQLRLIAPYFILSIISAGLGSFIQNYIQLPDIFMLFFKSGFVLGIYLLFNVLFKTPAIEILRKKFLPTVK